MVSSINFISLFPFLASTKTWIALFVLGGVHYILDRGKIIVFTQSSGDNFFNFILDQFLHIFTIWLVALWLSSGLNYFSFHLPPLYDNKAVLFASSVIIFAAFAGTPIIYYFLTYWHNKIAPTKGPIDYPALKVRLPGIIERAFAMGSIILGGYWLLIAPLFFAPWFFSKKDQLSYKLISAFSGVLICAFCGGIYFFQTPKKKVDFKCKSFIFFENKKLNGLCIFTWLANVDAHSEVRV